MMKNKILLLACLVFSIGLQAQKISDYTPVGVLKATDLMDLSEDIGGGSYATKSITGAVLKTFAADGSLYDNDGTLAGFRTVTMDGNNLLFTTNNNAGVTETIFDIQNSARVGNESIFNIKENTSGGNGFTIARINGRSDIGVLQVYQDNNSGISIQGKAGGVAVLQVVGAAKRLEFEGLDFSPQGTTNFYQLGNSTRPWASLNLDRNGSIVFRENATTATAQMNLNNTRDDGVTNKTAFRLQGPSGLDYTSTHYFTVRGGATDLSLFTIAPKGHVGIALGGAVGVVTSPAAALHVKGENDLSTSDVFRLQNQTGTNLVNIQNDGNVGIGTDAPVNSLHVQAFAGVNPLLVQANGSSNNLVVIDGGNVGIGVASPDALFNVEGGLAGNIAAFSCSVGGTSTDYGFGLDTDHTFTIGKRNTDVNSAANRYFQFVEDEDGEAGHVFRTYQASIIRHEIGSKKIKLNSDKASNITYKFDGNTRNNVLFMESTNNNVGFGTALDFGTGNGVIGIANAGTAPTTTPAGGIVVYADDTSDLTSTLGLETEQAVEAIGTFTPSHKLKIIINGATYWVQLDAE